MKSLDEIRSFFEQDRFATENGAVIDAVGEGYAKCSLVLNARHKNAAGGVMGGVPFTLADFTFAVAANHEVMHTVSLAANIAFLGVARGEKLIAEAHCVKNGRSTCYYTVSVKDALQNPVAEVTFSGFHKA